MTEPEFSSWVVTFYGPDTKYGTDGGDTLLVTIPPGDPPGVLTEDDCAKLMAMSFATAEDTGHRLHHADWVFTTDPARVAEIASRFTQPEAAAWKDRAVTALADRPGTIIAAGSLHWAATRGQDT